MDEAKIISRCLSGEKEAFEMIVNKYQSGLLSLTWSILRDREKACDATQEVFIRVYQKLKRFDQSRNFKNWLYSIAYKLCIDSIRKEKTFSSFLQKISDKRTFLGENPAKKLKVEESEIFSPFWKKLNDNERISLSLKINEGYSAEEIAGVLGCAESTVRVYLFNARMKLKKLLAESKYVQIL